MIIQKKIKYFEIYDASEEDSPGELSSKDKV